MAELINELIADDLSRMEGKLGQHLISLVSSCINKRLVYSAIHEGSQYCTDAGGTG